MIRVKCESPYCDIEFLVSQTEFDTHEYFFCKTCRREHSKAALIVQKEHGKSIDQIILDAAIFKTANGMADYIGISFVTLYYWINKYFGMNFQEFKRTYICESKKCYLLNIERSSYSRSDYVLRKIRLRRYCACINALDPGHIMTKAPLDVVADLLKNRPKLEKINDKFFVVGVVPFSFKSTVKPFYYKGSVVPLYM